LSFISTDEYLEKTSAIRQKAVVRQVQISEPPIAGIETRIGIVRTRMKTAGRD
jgi:hypothetical protein